MFEEFIKKIKLFCKDFLQKIGLIIVALPDIFKGFLKKQKEVDLKKRFIIIGAIAVFLIAASNDIKVLTSNLFAKPVYVVTVNGNEVGKVLIPKDEELSNEIVEKSVADLIADKEGVAVKISDTIKIAENTAPKKEISELAEVENQLADSVEYKIEAYDLIVDTEHIAFLNTDKEINEFLENIQEPYMNDNINEIYILEEVLINQVFTEKSNVVKFADIENILRGNKIEELKHTIVEGDTLWDLAIANEVTMEDIYFSNPDLTEDSILKLDSEIVIVTPVPFISVRTLEEVTYEAVAEREVVYVNNDEEYRTHRAVLQEGSDGTKIVTANIVRTNGIESDRLILEEVITVAPIEEIVEVGTLNLPPKKAIGTFIMPTTGRISDRFGTRSYGHKGIDIANSSGTRINASDGGKVTYAGWMGNYGNLVIIDHQNGYETYYGHNSSLTVSVGEMVAQGQQIARMGTTGRSTGNHCHFEVRVNGVPQNPFNYVSY